MNILDLIITSYSTKLFELSHIKSVKYENNVFPLFKKFMTKYDLNKAFIKDFKLIQIDDTITIDKEDLDMDNVHVADGKLIGIDFIIADFQQYLENLPIFVNLTGEDITLNNGLFYPSEGSLEYETKIEDFNDNDISIMIHSSRNPAPMFFQNVIYIVSLEIYTRSKHRTDFVTPAFLHPDCDCSGKIKTIPGFYK